MKTENRFTLKQITKKVAGLAPGKSFTVRTSNERVMALQVWRTLRRAGMVKFHAKTRAAKSGVGFKVSAE